MSLLTIALGFSLVFVVSCQDLTAPDQEDDTTKFGNLKFDDLPEHVKEVLRESREAGDTAHWCCNINPTKTIIDSHVTTTTIMIPIRHTHKHHCGFLGLHHCTSVSYSAGYKTGYQPRYSSRRVKTTCPDDHLVCCKDYIKVADHCLPQDRLPGIKDDLIQLHNAGIVVG